MQSSTRSGIIMLPGFHAQSGSRVTAKIYPLSSFNQKNNGDYNEGNITYDANGNIQTLQRNKNTVTGSNAMDKLTYNYDPAKPNQLNSVDDAVTTPTNAQDIKDQNPNNYKYNSIGQLTENVSEGIKYVYNASGLVTEVRKNSLPLVRFFYSDKGYRVKKEAYNSSGTLATTDYYVSDVAGNVMAIYRGSTLTEQAIYGAGRIGVYKRASNSSVYELTDHLGNVRAVIGKDSNNNMLMLSRRDYYPFGMPMPDRNIVGNYRYAFQGQELDTETGMEAFELRLWDGRIGRWLTVDPYGQYASPYIGMGNNPVNRIDPDGGADGDPIKFPENPCSGDSLTTAGGGNWSYNGKDWVPQGFNPQTLSEVVIGGSKGSSGLSTAGEIAIGFIPGSDIIGMYQGARDGNWGQFAMSTAFFAFDVATLGSGSILKGGIKAAIKVGEKQIVKEIAQEAVEIEGKHLLLTAGKKALHKHHILPQKFRTWFAERGVKNIDDYTVKLSQKATLAMFTMVQVSGIKNGKLLLMLIQPQAQMKSSIKPKICLMN